MRNAKIWLLALLLAFVLGACKSTPEEDTTPVEPPKPEPKPPVVDVLDPRDSRDVRNIFNEDSPYYYENAIIYFDFDQSTVKAQYRELVDLYAMYLRDNPNARYSLEGHADERGSREYNLGLGERRGNAVNAIMSAQGARSNQVDVVSYGEERPMCRESSESCWGQNRRVQIVITARG